MTIYVLLKFVVVLCSFMTIYYLFLYKLYFNFPDGKIIHIRGRLTWECCREKERNLPNVYHILVSRELR